MTKALGSRLASSVRQAKTKQPSKSMPDTQQVVETAKSKPELPVPSLPSRRVWPD